jgi:hypothetical protein
LRGGPLAGWAGDAAHRVVAPAAAHDTPGELPEVTRGRGLSVFAAGDPGGVHEFRWQPAVGNRNRHPLFAGHVLDSAPPVIMLLAVRPKRPAVVLVVTLAPVPPYPVPLCRVEFGCNPGWQNRLELLDVARPVCVVVHDPVQGLDVPIAVASHRGTPTRSRAFLMTSRECPLIRTQRGALEI